LDLFRSNCTTSARNALVTHERGEGVGEHTVAAKLKIQVVSYLDINNTQEALISSLELALIEDLNCNDGRVLYFTEGWS
jgi:hypothetical protein